MRIAPAALALTLALAGCTTTSVEPEPSPEPQVTQADQPAPTPTPTLSDDLMLVTAVDIWWTAQDNDMHTMLCDGDPAISAAAALTHLRREAQGDPDLPTLDLQGPEVLATVTDMISGRCDGQ